MKTKIMVALIAGFATGVSACGDDDPVGQEPLPEAPQLSIFPGIIDFAVAAVDVNETTIASASVTNTGQNDLELSNIAISGPNAGVFSVVSPTDGSATVSSRETILIQVEFAPSSRGVARAQLTVDSNASNLSSATLELVGPAVATKAGVEFPDLAAIDDPVTPFEGTSFGTVGLYNLGRASLVITDYTIADEGVFSLGAGVAVPGASCAMNGEADCNGNPDDPSDDRDLFCYTAETAETDDDVCAVSIPGESFVALQVDALGAGNTTLTVESNDPDGDLVIQLQN